MSESDFGFNLTSDWPGRASIPGAREHANSCASALGTKEAVRRLLMLARVVNNEQGPAERLYEDWPTGGCKACRRNTTRCIRNPPRRR